MSHLKARPLSDDEVDGLDESAVGVPAPHTASEYVADYALPTVVPRRVHPVAVVALILAFLLPIVAIPLAHKITRTLQHDGGRGRAVAQTAIVIGYLNILLLALLSLNVAVAVFLHSAV
ncbi:MULTISPECIES: DUF4190 domain-containing protein [unclassified Leifsonia]|uniref:DUF4190 domain-containing protein n=1 Tax=unclassified Leifsonia TaxID=2663824 RepID=UPI00036EE97B|nr:MULTISPECIES: DUF4190 domain-containing protein [unclassified Leifsonia]TDP98320.1 hypothetical protein AXZ95_2215 [Leifsonia sp. 115AMFTsu3.1]